MYGINMKIFSFLSFQIQGNIAFIICYDLHLNCPYKASCIQMFGFWKLIRLWEVRADLFGGRHSQKSRVTDIT